MNVHSKGNTLLVFLVSILFIALCAAVMWFLSDVTPLSVEYDEPDPVLSVATKTQEENTPTDTIQSEEVSPKEEESPSMKDSKEEVASFLTPTINPLSGVYTNPFE